MSSEALPVAGEHLPIGAFKKDLQICTRDETVLYLREKKSILACFFVVEMKLDAGLDLLEAVQVRPVPSMSPEQRRYKLNAATTSPAEYDLVAAPSSR